MPDSFTAQGRENLQNERNVDLLLCARDSGRNVIGQPLKVYDETVHSFNATKNKRRMHCAITIKAS